MFTLAADYVQSLHDKYKGREDKYIKMCTEIEHKLWEMTSMLKACGHKDQAIEILNKP